MSAEYTLNNVLGFSFLIEISRIRIFYVIFRSSYIFPYYIFVCPVHIVWDYWYVRLLFPLCCLNVSITWLHRNIIQTSDSIFNVVTDLSISNTPKFQFLPCLLLKIKMHYILYSTYFMRGINILIFCIDPRY